MSQELLRQLLIEEEGRIPYAYQDAHGFWTIGVGHLIDARKGGRLPEAIIDALLEYDLAEVRTQARTIPGYAQLNPVQRAVLGSMLFQMGLEPFDGDGVRDFRNFLRALATGDLAAAAAHGLDSKWAREDSPARARRQMRMLNSGIWEPKR